MARWQDRRLAIRHRPGITPDSEVQAMRIQAENAQDMAPKKEDSHKSTGNETIDLLRGLTAKAEAENLIKKPVKKAPAKKEIGSNEPKESKTLNNQASTKEGDKNGKEK